MSIKAGKGYDENGHPRGPIGGQCSECDGDIISIKMNTSRKGFETTSEKVCNKCGLIVPGAFQTLDPKSDYKGIYYATHEQWIEDQCIDNLNDADVAWENEQFAHVMGRRLNTSDEFIYSTRGKDGKSRENDESPFSVGSGHDAQSRNTYKDHLDYAIGLKSKRKLGVRAEDWNRGTEERMKHKHAQYYDEISICKSRFGMSYDQAAEVKYIVDNMGVEIKGHRKTYPYEDVILCISLVVMSFYVNNGYMATIKRQIPMWKEQYSILYKAIRSKLNV